MTTPLNRIRTPNKFKTTKEFIEHLNFHKSIHHQQFFDYEKEIESFNNHILEIKKQQKYHKDEAFDLDKEAKKYKKQKIVVSKYNPQSLSSSTLFFVVFCVVVSYFLFFSYLLLL